MGEEVTLTQWPSHIHKGTDALRIMPVPPGYTFSAEWERQHIEDARALLRETKLYIGDKYYGTLSEQWLWRSLPAGDVKLVRGNSLVVVKPLNELSTTRQIQLVVGGYPFAGQEIGNAILELQHAEVTLRSSEEAHYVYIVTLGREPTQRDIDEAARILPELLETPQQTTQATPTVSSTENESTAATTTIPTTTMPLQQQTAVASEKASKTVTTSVTQMPIELTATTIVILAVVVALLLAVLLAITALMRKKRGLYQQRSSTIIYD